jgi:hypothetical protein
MAFNISAAKEAGYSDEEISAYQQAEAEKNNRSTTVTTAVGDPPAPTTVVPEVEGGLLSPSGGMTTAMAAGAGAAAVGGPAALYYAGKKIFAPAAASGAQLAQRGVGALENANELARATEQRVAANQAAKAAAVAQPVAPSPILDSQGRPMQMQPRPVAPAGVPAAPVLQAAEQGVMNRAKQVVQQLAMSKLAPLAGNLLKGANVASLAGYSSDLGPKTPQAGRMRGMEINPLTGAPWTPEQIAQYEANPAQYDAQMAPPQFRR